MDLDERSPLCWSGDRSATLSSDANNGQFFAAFSLLFFTCPSLLRTYHLNDRHLKDFPSGRAILRRYLVLYSCYFSFLRKRVFTTVRNNFGLMMADEKLPKSCTRLERSSSQHVPLPWNLTSPPHMLFWRHIWPLTTARSNAASRWRGASREVACSMHLRAVSAPCTMSTFRAKSDHMPQ